MLYATLRSAAANRAVPIAGSLENTRKSRGNAPETPKPRPESQKNTGTREKKTIFRSNGVVKNLYITPNL